MTEDAPVEQGGVVPTVPNGANGAARSLKERAATWIINTVINMTNRKVNVAELQKKFKADQGRVSQMMITDIGKAWYFRVFNGKIEFMTNPPHVDGGFQMTTDTLMSISRGKQRRMDPATGRLFDIDFNPVDAVTQGLVTVWGEAASNDLLLFARATLEYAYPAIKQELNQVINQAPSV
jgi:hypothetical protein